MPSKKQQITDAERAKRIREAAREHETSNNPEDLDRAFEKVARSKSAGTDKPADRSKKSD
jgi:hypothetical protein